MVIESFNLGDTAFVNLNYQDEVLFLQLNGGEIWRSGAADLVLVGLDADGNTTTNEALIVSYMVEAYIGTPTNIFIPTKYNGKPITKIGASAFRENTTIESIFISKNVKSIGAYAFYESTATIIFEDGCEITELGESSFEGCKGLTEIPLGEGLVEIPTLALNSCENLKTLTIPSTVGYIGTFAISDGTILETITLKSILPPTMASINSLGLLLDTSKIYVPANGLQIYKADNVWGFFESCMIPYGEIQPSEGFVYTGLDSSGQITADEALIASYMIGDGSTTNNNGYNGTDANVVIPQTYNGKPITQIGMYAFRGNTSITTVYMPDTITSISHYAFESCSGLIAINISTAASYIGLYTFQNCSSLKRITIPAATTSLGDWVFGRCSNLVDVIFDSSSKLKTIPSAMCAYCTSIQKIEIPASINYIDANAFVQCSQLKYMIMNPTTPPMLVDTNAISTATTTISVPARSLSEYQTATNWNSYADIMVGFGEPQATEGLVYTGLDSSGAVTTDETAIAAYMIGSGEQAPANGYIGTDSEVIIPSTYNDKPVTHIGQLAFYGITYITSIQIPLSVTTISQGAFYGCDNLGSVEIPKNIAEIGAYAFAFSGITKATINSNVAGEQMFYECSSLNSVEINGNIPKIPNQMFYGCSNLTHIDLPSGITEIGHGAFKNSGLETIIIPEGVTIIGDSAFNNCPNLTEMTLLPLIPPTLVVVGSISTATTVINIPSGTYNAYSTATNWSNFTAILNDPSNVPSASWHTVWTGSLEYTHATITYSEVSKTVNGVTANLPTRVSGTGKKNTSKTFSNVELKYENGTNGTLVVNDGYDQYMLAPTTTNTLKARVKGYFMANGIILTEVQQYY